MKCPVCRVPGPCRGEDAPNLCKLVASGRTDYIPLLPRVDPPGPLRRAANFVESAFLHAKGGFRETPPEIARVRLARCQSCPQNVVGECQLCGCPVEVKVTWASEGCPAVPPLWEPLAAPDGGCGCG